MIPVWQTRHGAESLGNCLEACVASVLEVPLQVVPDRARHVNLDAWTETLNRARREGRDLGDLDLPEDLELGERDLDDWLRDRGLVLFTIDVHKPDAWLDTAAALGLTWIAHTRPSDGSFTHATVWEGRRCVHNPERAATTNPAELGRLRAAALLVASEPAKLARLDPLPDVRGLLDRTWREDAEIAEKRADADAKIDHGLELIRAAGT